MNIGQTGEYEQVSEREQNSMSAKGNEKREFPKNVRQIGEVGKEKRIYLEDYVVAYLRQVQGAVLLGQMTKIRGSRCYFVSGAVEVPDGEFDEENWAFVTEEAKQTFGELSIVGWFLRAEEIPEELNDEDMHVYKEHFPGREAILVVYNELEKEEAVYLTLDGFLRKQNGYYIYYEKNPQMQEYLIAKNEGRSVEKEAVVSDEAIQSFRRIIEGKKKNREEPAAAEKNIEIENAESGEEKRTLPLKSFWRREVQEQEPGDIKEAQAEKPVSKKKDSQIKEETEKEEVKSQNEDTEGKAEKEKEEGAPTGIFSGIPKTVSFRRKDGSPEVSPKVKTLHFLYTASTFLVLTILVIGVTMINNYDKMKKMEQAMAQMTEGAMVSAGVSGQETEMQTSSMRTTVIDVRTGETEILGGILKESEELSDTPGTDGVSDSSQPSTDAGQTDPGVAPGEPNNNSQGTGLSQDGNGQPTGGTTDGNNLTANGTTDGNGQPVGGISNESSLPANGIAGGNGSLATNAPAHASQASYTVKFGDTLEDICSRYYGSTDKLQDICDLNNILDPNAIMPGQKLALP